MASQALEILETLGGELVRYVPRLGTPKTIMALVQPVRRTDEMGRQHFLTKTYDVWMVRSQSEGIPDEPNVNADAIKLKLQPTDNAETTLRITKIHPERDAGRPGDGTGMWHVEAVA
jgi:hypothetical protein